MQSTMDPALEAGSPDVSSGGKRKSDDGGGHQRAKRNRYISIACNECKRRKIKCNGSTPCQRCGNLNLECVYAPNCCGTNFKESDEYRLMNAQIASLQEQVDTLYATLSSMRSEMATAQHPPIDPSLQQAAPYMDSRGGVSAVSAVSPLQSPSTQRPRSHTGPKQPTFRGLTSNEYSFDVAKSSLQTMGITASGQGTEDAGSREEPSPVTTPLTETRLHANKDPIWSMTKDEALRLLRVYEDEMHEMYPVVSLSRLRAHVQSLYKFLDAASRSGLVWKTMPGADTIDDEDTNLLKLVCAVATTCEGSGRSELGQRMFDSVQPQVETMLSGNAGLKDILLLVLTATYYFQTDNESTSWRIIGLAARLCIELGLHRRETYDKMTSEDDRKTAILLFWSIYVLDRRWSFGTGMPFSMQDSDLDPTLPRPGDEFPYVKCMIDFCAIGAKVWRAIGAENTNNGFDANISQEDMAYLDYQVKHWHRSLPSYLTWNTSMMNQHESDSSIPAIHRLRMILFFRRNSMLMQIYRPVLHSATSIVNNRNQAQEVVNVAQDTIRALTYINQTSTVYRGQPVFNAFLTSALAVLFLAVSHTPALFAEQVREEFYMALDIVRSFSKGSWVGMRLWKTIRVLKEVGPKLGLRSRGEQQVRKRPDRPRDDGSRSAAVAMAGLAGHTIDEMALYGRPSPTGQWPANASIASSSPDNMATDLTSLFEAVGGYNGNGYGTQGARQGNGAPGQYPVATPGTESSGLAGDVAAFGGDEELSRIMKELF